MQTESTLKTNPCYSYQNRVLLEIHGKMDLPIDENCERYAYQGPKTNPDRISYTLENFKIWKQIYESGFKFDIMYIDNGSQRAWMQIFPRVYSALNFTNSYMTCWNRNPIDYMQAQGGEKSGIVLTYKFMAGGMADHLGYDAILHWNVRYTPKFNYNWNGLFNTFFDNNLDLMITPSRYGKKGFNTNCMIVKPQFWREWSRSWNYTPTRLNCEGLDVYESLQNLGLVDGDDEQPYSKVDISRMRIYTRPPYEWYDRTSQITMQEDFGRGGYYVIRNRYQD